LLCLIKGEDNKRGAQSRERRINNLRVSPLDRYS
jgi:hypothetical protein